ncbi:MAG: PadR family transcriptional regulator [Anaerolineales bacterium]|nr:PadR family transcriptional regulator [Anaerolineales bacterium]
MSLKHALLGFLELVPLSGYDLKKALDGSVQHFWPADQAQIYRTLSRLHDDGLVSVDVVEQTDRPDRKVYHITPNGRAELHSWLAQPLPPTNEREPLLVRIFFSGFLDDAALLPLLTAAAQQEDAYLAQLHAILADARQRMQAVTDPARQRIGFFQMLTIERAILHQQAQIAWLQSLAQRLQDHNLTLSV